MQEGIFKTLKALRSAYTALPGITSCREYEIMIEIGYHQEMGAPLTLKRLLLLDIASDSTVHRHLRLLVGKGMAMKSNSSQDRREVHLELSPLALAHFHDHWRQIAAIVRNKGEEKG